MAEDARPDNAGTISEESSSPRWPDLPASPAASGRIAGPLPDLLEADTPSTTAEDAAAPVSDGPGADAEPSGASPDSLRIGTDGRPSWWYAGVVTDGRVSSACGEALGDDMAAARAAAIESARARLRERIELPEGIESVRRTLVWPLRGGKGVRGYAGYAEVEVVPAG